VPEAFIWLVFRGLAEALFLLNTGEEVKEAALTGQTLSLQLRRAVLNGWDPVIHTDIKPMNIVLGDPLTSFPAFKTAKLIDFGCCLSESQHMRQVRGNMHQIGTPGHRPPVMERLRNCASVS
jgi:serine/threonine protein kinase